MSLQAGGYLTQFCESHLGHRSSKEDSVEDSPNERLENELMQRHRSMRPTLIALRSHPRDSVIMRSFIQVGASGTTVDVPRLAWDLGCDSPPLLKSIST